MLPVVVGIRLVTVRACATMIIRNPVREMLIARIFQRQIPLLLPVQFHPQFPAPHRLQARVHPPRSVVGAIGAMPAHVVATRAVEVEVFAQPIGQSHVLGTVSALTLLRQLQPLFHRQVLPALLHRRHRLRRQSQHRHQLRVDLVAVNCLDTLRTGARASNGGMRTCQDIVSWVASRRPIC